MERCLLWVVLLWIWGDYCILDVLNPKHHAWLFFCGAEDSSKDCHRKLCELTGWKSSRRLLQTTVWYWTFHEFCEALSLWLMSSRQLLRQTDNAEHLCVCKSSEEMQNRFCIDSLIKSNAFLAWFFSLGIVFVLKTYCLIAESTVIVVWREFPVLCTDFYPWFHFRAISNNKLFSHLIKLVDALSIASSA